MKIIQDFYKIKIEIVMDKEMVDFNRENSEDWKGRSFHDILKIRIQEGIEIPIEKIKIIIQE